MLKIHNWEKCNYKKMSENLSTRGFSTIYSATVTVEISNAACAI